MKYLLYSLLLIINFVGGYFFCDLVINGYITQLEGFTKTSIVIISIIIDLIYFTKNYERFK